MSDSVRSASTVILLRDGIAGLETYLMRRVASMAFAPRMHVFPGGRVDEVDFSAPVVLAGADLTRLAARASADVPELLALYACAVRETREETGIDLATAACDGSLLVDPSALPIVDHWVTPEGETRRYDVRFFAAMVVGDEARLTTTEADEVLWSPPAAALDAFAAGQMPMLPPTESVLRWLADFDSAAGVLMAGAERPVVPLLPRRVPDAEGKESWALVHDRTGEVVRADVTRPHTRESDGLPRTEP